MIGEVCQCHLYCKQFLLKLFLRGRYYFIDLVVHCIYSSMDIFFYNWLKKIIIALLKVDTLVPH